MITEAHSVVRTGTSADIIRDIFALHFPNARTVLDLTFGLGVFWKWDFVAAGLTVHINDAFQVTRKADERFNLLHRYERDCRATGLDAEFDVVVFDPPFSAMGERSDGGEFSERYGGTRKHEGAPQNISDIVRLTLGGVLETTRLATQGIIVKTQAVVESGRVWNTPGDVSALLSTPALKYRVVEPGMGFLPHRPTQDGANKARGATVRNFQRRPSVFIVAKPTGRKRK